MCDSYAQLSDRLTPLVSSVSPSTTQEEESNADESRENILGEDDSLGGSISCCIDICQEKDLFEGWAQAGWWQRFYRRRASVWETSCRFAGILKNWPWIVRRKYNLIIFTSVFVFFDLLILFKLLTRSM